MILLRLSKHLKISSDIGTLLMCRLKHSGFD
jgi:hypothetical protein